MWTNFTPEARSAIERIAAQPDASEAERVAYADLCDLARTWRKRNTAECVANALKAGAGLPFTES